MKKPKITELDKLARKLIRLRDNWTCQRCGRQKKHGWRVDVAHFFPRQHTATRCHSDNLVLLCEECHIRWAHENKLAFSDWWRQRIGEERYDKLKEKKSDLDPDIWEIKGLLVEEIKKLEGRND
jgi:5-methylcytosine-specific restriction endonuclease McrA